MKKINKKNNIEIIKPYLQLCKGILQTIDKKNYNVIIHSVSVLPFQKYQSHYLVNFENQDVFPLILTIINKQ